jgi:hypothetical protein
MSGLQEILKAVAPVLGTALGGPLGGAAAAFIADKLGLESKTVESVAAVLSSSRLTPEQITQVRQAEIDFEKFCKSHQIDLEKVHAADRDSAREMLIATRTKVPAWLTFLITVGFFGVLAAMFKWPEMKESAPLMIMLGSLGTAWTGACAFWFGSTSGSSQKNELLAMTKTGK